MKFFSWIEKELKQLVGAAPKIEHILAVGLKYAGPALQVIVTKEAGAAAGAEVGKVIANSQAALAATSALVYDFGANPTFSTVLTEVAADLTGLMSAGHITNPDSQKALTTVVNNLSDLAQGLSAAPVPAPVAA
jgi:hypothetical protein